MFTSFLLNLHRRGYKLARELLLNCSVVIDIQIIKIHIFWTIAEIRHQTWRRWEFEFEAHNPLWHIPGPNLNSSGTQMWGYLSHQSYSNNLCPSPNNRIGYVLSKHRRVPTTDLHLLPLRLKPNAEIPKDMLRWLNTYGLFATMKGMVLNWLVSETSSPIFFVSATCLR